MPRTFIACEHGCVTTPLCSLKVVCELSPNAQSMDMGGRDVGRVRAIAEEPFIQVCGNWGNWFIELGACVAFAHLESLTSRSGVKQFPITERDRELDQLRYLVATSATPDADQRRAGDGASAYASMIAPRDAPR